jgi:TPR repeat protein
MNSEVKEDTNNIDEVEKELKELLEKYEYSYDPPKNKEMIKKIYDLYKNKIIDNACDDDDYLTYLGFYYNSVKNNRKLTLKYYDKAIKKGNPHAMYNKAIICMDDKRYDEMIMYLKMPLLF